MIIFVKDGHSIFLVYYQPVYPVFFEAALIESPDFKASLIKIKEYLHAHWQLAKGEAFKHAVDRAIETMVNGKEVHQNKETFKLLKVCTNITAK
jgi:hypothetical protein